MEEQAYVAGVVSVIGDVNPSKEDVPAKVHEVRIGESKPYLGISGRNLGDQTIAFIDHFLLPLGAANPGKAAINPDASTGYTTFGMVLLTDTGVIDIPDVVINIEIDEQVTIADR
jgi:hypothetical protein